MEPDVGSKRVEASRASITEYMKGVSAVGESFGEFGGYHATAPKGWVTNNANIHSA